MTTTTVQQSIGTAEVVVAVVAVLLVVDYVTVKKRARNVGKRPGGVMMVVIATESKDLFA